MGVDDNWDEFDPDESEYDAEDNVVEDCGRWWGGKIIPWADCRLAGTEFCDFECPLGRAVLPALQAVRAEG